VIRIAVWVVDFTERKLAVDALKASEEKFRELAENIPEIFWIRKGDEMLYVSPAYEIICGKSCESSTGA
jgi:PAS domain-containing protein